MFMPFMSPSLPFDRPKVIANRRFIRTFYHNPKGQIAMRIVSTALVVALSLALVTGCTGTQAERQESADQKFGQAKVYLAIGTAAVAGYDILCQDTLAQSAVCGAQVYSIVNLAMQGASDAVVASEKVFAAANTEAEKLNAANAALAAVAELTKAIAKYGVAFKAG